MGLFTSVRKNVVNRGAKIGQALFPGLSLAVGLGKFGADSGKTSLAVDRTVVKFDGQVHGEDFGAFYREGKDLPLFVNVKVNGVGGRFEVKGLIPPLAFHLPLTT